MLLREYHALAPGPLIDALLEQGRRFTDHQGFADDVTLVAMRVEP